MLLDPKALQAAMPGCERFVEVAPSSYDVTIKIGIAAIKGTYQLIRNPSYLEKTFHGLNT